MSLFDLSGKVAIITGSSRGIGRAIAERLAEHGAKVVVSSRKAEACKEVADAINKKHGKDSAVVVPANISSKDDLKNLVEEATRKFGKIDILVCNAASNPYFGPLGGIQDDQFRKILDNNILSNHWLAQLVSPQMIKRREGPIIIFFSIGGLRGSPMLESYCICKAPGFQLAHNLATEYGAQKARGKCISRCLANAYFPRRLL